MPEYFQVFPRFFTVRGQATVMMSDNGSQFSGAEKELRQLVRGLEKEEIRVFFGERGMQWTFITPAATHQNGCAEAS